MSLATELKAPLQTIKTCPQLVNAVNVEFSFLVSFSTSRTIWGVILLMVQKSGDHHLKYIKPSKLTGCINYQPQLVIAGFLPSTVWYLISELTTPVAELDIAATSPETTCNASSRSSTLGIHVEGGQKWCRNDDEMQSMLMNPTWNIWLGHGKTAILDVLLCLRRPWQTPNLLNHLYIVIIIMREIKQLLQSP